MLYAKGYGAPRSDADSPLELLRKAAKGGYSPASFLLAERYRYGLGVSLDYIQSVQFYQAATYPILILFGESGSQSQSAAMGDLGVVDQNLEPTLSVSPGSRNFARAVSNYRKATEKHDSAAMEQIGEWYLEGRFEPKNPVEAFRWFTLAANNGNAGAGIKRDLLKAKLTPEQLQQIK